MSNIDAALGYAKAGKRIFPIYCIKPDGSCSCNEDCGKAGKHPMGLLVPNGFKNASSDEETICQWWTKEPLANIGSSTGGDYFVMDIDPRNGGDETLDELVEIHGPLPDTPEVLTGGGGRHIYFKTPPGISIPCSQGQHNGLPGIDIKGNGGYVLVPPSNHISGKQYEWEASSHPDEVELAEAPAWLIERIQKCADQRPPILTVKPKKPMLDVIPEGSRDETLFRQASSLWARGYSEKLLWLALQDLNEKCRPPLPERQVQKIFTSITKRYEPGKTRVFESPFPPEPESEMVELPQISTKNRYIREMTADALVVLEEYNQSEPKLFGYANNLARIRFNDEGIAKAELLNEDSLSGILDRVACWCQKDDDKIIKKEKPPKEVVKDILSLPEHPFPKLAGVSEIPLLTKQGELVYTNGFHGPSGFYFQIDRAIEPYDFSSQFDTEALTEAKSFIFEEYLGDFPFADEASKAHTIAALLLPFVEPVIEGSSPLHLIEAELPGTGKTLLAETIGLITHGTTPPTLAQATCDEEWRKRITALKLQAPALLLFDNLTELDSPAVANYITTRRWVDRILRTSKVIDITSKELLLATGNSVYLSKEIARRTVKIILRTDEQEPYLRNDFKQPNLQKWIRENRPKLVRCLLMFIHNWVLQGMPAGTASIGSFESWSEVIGGILQAAGIPDFLHNYNPDGSSQGRLGGNIDLGFLFELLAHAFAGQPFTPSNARSILQEVPQGLQIMGNKTPISQTTKLGFWLSKLVNRQIGQHQLIQDGTNRGGAKIYQIVEVQSDA